MPLWLYSNIEQLYVYLLTISNFLETNDFTWQQNDNFATYSQFLLHKLHDTQQTILQVQSWDWKILFIQNPIKHIMVEVLNYVFFSKSQHMYCRPTLHCKDNLNDQNWSIT